MNKEYDERSDIDITQLERCPISPKRRYTSKCEHFPFYPRLGSSRPRLGLLLLFLDRHRLDSTLTLSHTQSLETLLLFFAFQRIQFAIGLRQKTRLILVDEAHKVARDEKMANNASEQREKNVAW